MRYSAINTAFAVLALLANTIVLITAGGFLVSRASAAQRAGWDDLRAQLTPVALPLAWVVAVVCTSASLFLQYGEELIPCDLCWLQRICMYPQALILGLAVFTGDRYMIKRYMIPLALVGATISVVHIALPALMRLFNASTFPGCSAVAPCNIQYITIWGFVTIPYMALSGFLLIITMLLLVRDVDHDASIAEGAQAA